MDSDRLWAIFGLSPFTRWVNVQNARATWDVPEWVDSEVANIDENGTRKFMEEINAEL